MNREKLYELVKEDVVKSSAYPSVIMNYLANIEPPIDFRLGGAISECFDENEELSPPDSEVKYFARVVGDAVLPKGRAIKYFSSEFKLIGGYEGSHTLNYVNLCGSELTIEKPLPIDLLALENNSKADIKLKEKSVHGVVLSAISLYGENCEVRMNAEVEDKIEYGFALVVRGGNNRAELDLRKLDIKKFNLVFNHSGENNYVHVKLNENTEVESMFWNSEIEGVKIILEGGGEANVEEIINSGVDFERR